MTHNIWFNVQKLTYNEELLLRQHRCHCSYSYNKVVKSTFQDRKDTEKKEYSVCTVDIDLFHNDLRRTVKDMYILASQLVCLSIRYKFLKKDK